MTHARTRRLRPLGAALAALLLCSAPVPAAVPPGGLASLLAVPAGETSAEASAIRAFYQARDFQPAWDPARALLLMERLGRAGEEGLDPARFQDGRLTLPSGDPARELALTRAYLRYARAVGYGLSNPKEADPGWLHAPRAFEPEPLLRRLADTADLAALLESLPPADPGYLRLRKSLAHHRELAAAGGWPHLPAAEEGEKLEIGDLSPAVAALRERLRATGELDADADGDEVLFDETLQAAVIRFQLRHGLEPDGVVGKRTRRALNTSVEARIRQIALTMERKRWLPPDRGAFHVMVNVPGYWLEAVRDGEVALAMKVVVGRPSRRTPSFLSPMTHLVLNPPWTVPNRILREDIIPAVREDPDYLARKHFRLLDGWSPDAEEIDPATLDWDAVSGRNFPYRLRRDPGPDNDLGQVKFQLRNGLDIYLHDTPSRKLFGKARRAFSSGCVRLEKPLELAQLVMGWDAQRLQEALAPGKTRHVALPSQVPVYIVYETAWVEADGIIQFRDDVYGRDEKLARALGGA